MFTWRLVLQADDVDKKFVFKLHHKNIRVYFFEGEDENAVKR